MPVIPLPRRLAGALASALTSSALVATLACSAGTAALAATAPPVAPAARTSLPEDVANALARASVPEDAVAVALHDATSGRPLLRWRDAVPVNPASLAKLLTTAAALDRLGPAWSWTTPVWIAGTVKDGVLDGSLHLQGSGDPKLVLERLWLLLRRVQQFGVREIRGDIVLDQRAFAPAAAAPGDFDGEPLRPYNVQPAALLLNYRSVLYTFVPDAAAGVAWVGIEPPLARTVVDRVVPLAAGPCDDWRGALRASFTEQASRFAGSYPAACGELTWPVADPQPASYDARLVEGLWREMGGQLAGRVREGPAPATRPTFELRSPPLAELVRDINKFSNNVMAEQLFLTLAAQAQPGQPATPEAARAWLGRWLGERLAPGAGDPGGERPPDLAVEAVIRNGSGLARDGRLSARVLARLLVAEFSSPAMPELMASLPIAATDGTLRRARMPAGRAHLKTGSLADVAGIAGYLLPPQGPRLVLVAIVNHPNANATRPALDALVNWALAAGSGAGAGAGATPPAAAAPADIVPATRRTADRAAPAAARPGRPTPPRPARPPGTHP
jgi:D-alanyl-D-alanine carboxypeptidase/D-alanyl-D-alanine-endopeptidase (penicillin-binding protein 4)